MREFIPAILEAIRLVATLDSDLFEDRRLVDTG